MAKRPHVNPGADALAKELDKRGMTQGALRRALGLSQGVVTRWLSGRQNPNLEYALRLEDEFGVNARLWPTNDGG